MSISVSQLHNSSFLSKYEQNIFSGKNNLTIKISHVQCCNVTDPLISISKNICLDANNRTMES